LQTSYVTCWNYYYLFCPRFQYLGLLPLEEGLQLFKPFWL
jgi:hypothetical protein